MTTNSLGPPTVWHNFSQIRLRFDTSQIPNSVLQNLCIRNCYVYCEDTSVERYEKP